VVSISCVWPMTWWSSTIEEAGDSINQMGSIKFKWGTHGVSIPCISLTTWQWVLIDEVQGWDVLAFPNMAYIF